MRFSRLMVWMSMMIYVTGSVVALVRWLTGGLPEETDVEYVQSVFEFACVMGLIVTGMWVINRMRKSNLKKILQFLGMFGLCAFVMFCLPEDVQRDPSANRPLMMAVAMAAMLAVMIILPWAADRRQRKLHPDGFYEPFMRAYRAVRSGGAAYAMSSTGKTIMYVDGMVTWSSDMGPDDIESKWKIIENEEKESEDDLDDRDRECRADVFVLVAVVHSIPGSRGRSLRKLRIYGDGRGMSHGDLLLRIGGDHLRHHRLPLRENHQRNETVGGLDMGIRASLGKFSDDLRDKMDTARFQGEAMAVQKF